jgi:hypothetical protein
MDEHKLTELLRRKSAEVQERTRFCPDDGVITEYFEGSLAAQAHHSLKRHLVDCRFCQARIGNLNRLNDAKELTGVAESVLADAKRLVTPASPPRTRYTPAWATAAVVVLALFIITKQGSRSGSDPVNSGAVLPPVTGSPREVRSVEPAGSAPRIILPAEGASIEADDLMIRWTEVSGSLHYDVRVVTTEGYLVWTGRVEDTELTPQDDFLLEPGKEYFVRVDAYMAEANSVSSDHILFSVEKHPQ